MNGPLDETTAAVAEPTAPEKSLIDRPASDTPVDNPVIELLCKILDESNKVSVYYRRKTYLLSDPDAPVTAVRQYVQDKLKSL
jgi:hypothetical protein